MKKCTLFMLTVLLSLVLFQGNAQETPQANYWQVKIDFLEPIVNGGYAARLDYGFNRHLVGLVAGFSGKVSEFDNRQYKIFDDKTNFRVGLEYQYFLSASKINRGFYVGADFEYAQHEVVSKTTNETIDGIAVITPGIWIGFLWKPFKNANLIVDLTILHPRYSFGDIEEVTFKTVSESYKPENLFQFLGPWSIGWRF